MFGAAAYLFFPHLTTQRSRRRVRDPNSPANRPPGISRSL